MIIFNYMKIEHMVNTSQSPVGKVGTRVGYGMWNKIKGNTRGNFELCIYKSCLEFYVRESYVKRRVCLDTSIGWWELTVYVLYSILLCYPNFYLQPQSCLTSIECKWLSLDCSVLFSSWNCQNHTWKDLTTLLPPSEWPEKTGRWSTPMAVRRTCRRF